MTTTIKSWRAIAWLLLCCCYVGVLASQPFEEAVATDIFPPVSPKCEANQQHGTTSFNFTFSPSHESHWNPRFVSYEEMVFLVEIDHQNANDENKTWKMRLGRGGQVYSWIGPYGEAIPPQAMKSAAWMDTVLQMVSVDQVLNSPEHPYFIHQAGTYMSDPSQGVPPPFYSPALAIHCADHSCHVVSWGQQAHIPTIHTSDIIYYSRYTNCGNGAIEITQIIHNGGEDTLTYMNVPWMGIRRSTLNNVVLSHPNGTLNPQFPLKRFGDGTCHPPLSDTGGFTSFVQSMPLPVNATFQLPCVTLNKKAEIGCDAVNHSKPMEMIVQANYSCQYVAGLSMRYEANIVRMRVFNLEATVEILGCRKICGPNGLYFVNGRTGFTIHVTDVVLWGWYGKYVYFASNATDAQINAEFLEGDAMLVEYAKGNGGSLSLTFVHGQDPEYDDPVNTWFAARSRLRFGSIYDVDRDLIVYVSDSVVCGDLKGKLKQEHTLINVQTINFIGTIGPGQTYVNQFFAVTGELLDSVDSAKTLVDSTYQDILMPEKLPSTELYLVFNDNTFSVVAGSTTCAEASDVCNGYSTPRNGSRAFFFVQCANATYVGPDQYHFAKTEPSNDGTIKIRPYVCDGFPVKIRPAWKLLGYFDANKCTLPVVTFNASLCSNEGGIDTT